MVCHAPGKLGPLGTLFIESRRHILDFAEFDELEAATYAVVLRRVYAALRPLVGAQRIYTLNMTEGMPHFHAWIVPRPADSPERGIKYLSKDITCTLEQASQLAAGLRTALWSAS